jgi:hypothetical protein
MAALTVELQLHELTCGSCRARPVPARESDIDYFVAELQGEDDDEPISVDVKSLSFTESEPGRVRVEAVLDLACIDCGSDAPLRRLLEAPTLLVRDNVRCASNHPLRTAGTRSYRFTDSAETGPSIEISSEWECEICVEAHAATISVPLSPELMKSDQVPIEFNGSVQAGVLQIVLGAGSAQHTESHTSVHIASPADLSRALAELAGQVAGSDIEPELRTRLADALSWCSTAAALSDQPADAAARVSAIRSAAGWVGQRLTNIVDAAGGALVGNWLVALLSGVR